MTARIEPLQKPYPQEIEASFNQVMPTGLPPLHLFTTLARDSRLWSKFSKGSLLDKGHLTLRQREIVIHRTTALCRSEYEWGVHASFFAKGAGFDPEQLHSTVYGNSSDPCWSDEERPLIAACDELHANCEISDATWASLRGTLSEEGAMELIMVAGFYRTVGYLTNSLKLPLEAYAKRFPLASGQSASENRDR